MEVEETSAKVTSAKNEATGMKASAENIAINVCWAKGGPFVRTGPKVGP